MKPSEMESKRHDSGARVFHAIQAITKRESPRRNQGVPMPRATPSVKRPKRSLEARLRLAELRSPFGASRRWSDRLARAIGVPPSVLLRLALDRDAACLQLSSRGR